MHLVQSDRRKKNIIRFLQRKLKLGWLLVKRALRRVDRMEWGIAFICSLVVLYGFSNESHHWAAYPVIYMFSIPMLAPLRHFRCLRYIYEILWIPAFVFMIVAPIYIPLAAWLLSQVMIIGGTFTLLELILTLLGLESNLNLLLYLGLTLSAILLTTIGNRVYRFFPFKEPNKEFIEVGMKIHSQKRTRVYIYATYFVILVTSMISKLTNKSIFPSEVVGEVYIQSFATYLAFDRIQNAVKDISIKVKLKELWREYVAAVGLKNR